MPNENRTPAGTLRGAVLEVELEARLVRWAYAPWAALIALLGAAGLWLLSQPMEMRGMMMG